LAQKHLLTILHCVIALVVTIPGMVWSRIMAESQPLGSLFVLVGVVVLPVFIATRVAWASGYAAGVRQSGRRRDLHPE
jgi:hypothetical protein